jgi:hypothetical protein
VLSSLLSIAIHGVVICTIKIFRVSSFKLMRRMPNGPPRL